MWASSTACRSSELSPSGSAADEPSHVVVIDHILVNAEDLAEAQNADDTRWRAVTSTILIW